MQLRAARQLSPKEVFAGLLTACAKPCMEDQDAHCCYVPEAISCAPCPHHAGRPPLRIVEHVVLMCKRFAHSDCVCAARDENPWRVPLFRHDQSTEAR